MKKILMICEAFEGGVFAYLTQLCNDMCDDFTIYLAYSLRPRTPTNYKDQLDHRIHLIQIKEMSGSIFSLVHDIKAIQALRALEKEIQPDIIHLHSSIAGGLGRLAFKGKNNTVIYTPHGYAHILMGPGLKSLVYKSVEKVLGKTNSITLTCCESEDEEARRFSKRTAYIETGVNLADLSASLDGIIPVKNDKFTVFTLGRACAQKRPDLFNRIAELVPQARFVWIGNGELENQLTAPNITVTGWKPRKEALAMAKGADAFILCSYGEAIAMSLIENMYMKKLVLVSNTMGNKSVIKDGVNGYVCDTAEEYAERLHAAMQTFPQKLTEKAYADVQNVYNTNVMKEKYISFYGKLTRGEKNSPYVQAE